ncbi:MAG: hypothetical protein IRY96_04790, partial [Burkholderiales bacterium]|nr:hypothetical protein [Burkholderiales bacterium]
MKTYIFPNGQLVDEAGNPTIAGRAYLQAIQDWNTAIRGVTNLDSGTSYTNDQLRDKLIELISILQG